MTCDGGYLRLVEGSLKDAYTAESFRDSSHEAFDYDWVRKRFSALFQCDNPACKECATVSGDGTVDQVPDEDMRHAIYEDEYVPTYFHPSPHLIQIPPGCPPEARSSIERAFVASWGDPSSAANHARTAVERILDAAGINKTRPRKKAGRERIPLHDRIELLGVKNKTACDALMAIKWVGNAGSHTSELDREGIFKLFDMLELALQELYVGHNAQITRLIASINRRRGLPRARTP
jgi:hypothetical protein